MTDLPPAGRNAQNNFDDIRDIQDIRDESDENFMARIAPTLRALETIRQRKSAAYKFRKALALPAALILTPLLGYLDYLLLLWQRGSDDGAAGLSALFLGALYAWVTHPKRQYAKAYKKQILPHLAKALGNLRYRIDGKIPMAALSPSKIVPGHDRYKAEDYFEGRYKGIHLRFSEIKLQQKRRSRKRTYYVTVFRGLCVLLDIAGHHKKFTGHTIMAKDQGKLSEWFKEKTMKLDRARLVDPAFEKLFDVYTNDQTEARYLIDPVMIERIKNLYEEYDGKTLSAAWYDSKMLILIASKHNHFEPADLSTPAADPQTLRTLKQEIGEILSIVDRLELYDRGVGR